MGITPFEKHSLISPPSFPSESASAEETPQQIYNAALALLFNRCFTTTLSICLLGLTASYIPVEARTDLHVLPQLQFYLATVWYTAYSFPDWGIEN